MCVWTAWWGEGGRGRWLRVQNGCLINGIYHLFDPSPDCSISYLHQSIVHFLFHTVRYPPISDAWCVLWLIVCHRNYDDVWCMTLPNIVVAEGRIDNRVITKWHMKNGLFIGRGKDCYNSFIFTYFQIISNRYTWRNESMKAWKQERFTLCHLQLKWQRISSFHFIHHFWTSYTYFHKNNFDQCQNESIVKY